VADPTFEQRLAAAKALQTGTPLILASVTLGIFMAVLDLLTGAVVDDRRFDILVLSASGLALWGLLSMRRIARRVLSDELPIRPTPLWWAREAIASVALIGVLAGLGYLLGGRWPAIFAALSYPAFLAVAIGLGKREHRERTRASR
jgi:hypothetical protein